MLLDYRIVLFYLLTIFSCTRQESVREEIIGAWELNSIKFEDRPKAMAVEYLPGAPFYPIERSRFIITRDSISYFDYPLQYLGRYSYKISSGEMFINKDLWYKNPASIKIMNEQLIKKVKLDDGPWQSFTEIYSRTELDDQLINRLKRDTINLDLLIGNWNLETIFNPDSNDGAEPFEIEFPFEMPATLTYTKETISSANILGNDLIIEVDNIAREFEFEYIYEGNIRLEPKAWYKGEEGTLLFYSRAE